MLEKLLHLFIKNLDYLFLGFGIFLGFLSMLNIKKILIWIKGGIENSDGKLENKELQITFFSLLAAFEVIMIAIHASEFPDSVIYSTFGLAGFAYTANRGFTAYNKNKDS